MIARCHIPTLLLIIGYPVYWLELFFVRHPTGHATWLAWIFFIAVVGIAFLCSCPCRVVGGRVKELFDFMSLSLAEKVLFCLCLLLVGFILFVALRAACLPPHLLQEYDVLNYHITIPRQHLLMGSFAHIAWSTADLYLLPLDYALAPFWLATSLPNKIPQFIFLAGLLVLGWDLTCKLSSGNRNVAWLVVFLIAGAHAIGIQAGTAMLDIVICYLALAVVHSLLEGRMWLAAVEGVFLVFSKSFMPVLVLAVLFILGCSYLIARQAGVRNFFILPGYKERVALNKHFWLAFLLISFFVAGPFLWRSWMTTGSPLFPLGVSFKTAAFQHKAGLICAVKDAYGMPRDLLNFMKHVWIVAVPEGCVNNRFDYPLGLTFLMCVGPFVYFFVGDIRKKAFSIFSFIVAAYWVVWWMGSQQSRFLYVPMVFMFIDVALRIGRASYAILFCLCVALGLNGLSVWRAHAADFSKSSLQILRDKDKMLLERARETGAGDVVDVSFSDAAFAEFKVNVTDVASEFVIRN